MNPRITPKDIGTIKGALRRAFARSDLHNEVITASIVEHSDPKRPRVKTWCRCNVCAKPEAKSYMQVDHITPYVPLDKTIHDLELLELINRLWCDKKNLQSICPACHDQKTSLERDERKRLKKEKKKNVKPH